MSTPAPTLPLVNGARIPHLGLGTWPLDDDGAEKSVATAIEGGYRLVDTAENYENERGVGRGLRASGVPREELFVTTKFNRRWHSVDGVREAFERSAERLGVDYVDLLLVHWPNPDQGRYVEAFEGIVALLREGLVRAAGTSNFTPAQLQEAIDATGVTPDVNQIQLNPYIAQTPWREFAAERGIVIEGYSPIWRGRDLLDEPVVAEAAARARPHAGADRAALARAAGDGAGAQVRRPAPAGGEPRGVRLRADRRGDGGALGAGPGHRAGDGPARVRALTSLCGSGIRSPTLRTCSAKR